MRGSENQSGFPHSLICSLASCLLWCAENIVALFFLVWCWLGNVMILVLKWVNYCNAELVVVFFKSNFTLKPCPLWWGGSAPSIWLAELYMLHITWFMLELFQFLFIICLLFKYSNLTDQNLWISSWWEWTHHDLCESRHCVSMARLLTGIMCTWHGRSGRKYRQGLINNQVVVVAN